MQAANGIFYPVPENNYLEDSEGYETFLGYVDLDVYDIGICAAGKFAMNILVDYANRNAM